MIKDKNKILFLSCGEISDFTFTAGRANYLPKWARLPCVDWPILYKGENCMCSS